MALGFNTRAVFVEGFRDSPVSKLLSASAIMQKVVSNNEHLFTFAKGSEAEERIPDPYDHVLAMHLRRGD